MVTDGLWHHVLVKRNAEETMTFYVDGERRSVCENTGVPSIDNMQDLTIGATHGIIAPPHRVASSHRLGSSRGLSTTPPYGMWT
jgi:hypothetical protein